MNHLTITCVTATENELQSEIYLHYTGKMRSGEMCVILPDSIDQQIHDRSQAVQEFGLICRLPMLSKLNTNENDR